MTHLLIKLLFAHIFGDFALQPNWLNNGKSDKKKGIWYQLLHGVIHAILAYTIVADWANWIIPLVIFVTHVCFDTIKARKHGDSTKWFLADQFCHLAVIVILWICFGDTSALLSALNTGWISGKMWIIALAYLLILKPTSILLDKFFTRWQDKLKDHKGLPNAGMWIGYCERVLIVTFILTGNVEGIGFLLAAKSVFRFGDLNKEKEVATTEYVLFGTLASFGLATIIGFLATLAI